LGGSVGLMLAARHPQSISRLVVVDVPAFMGALFGPPGATAESVRPVADAILARTLAASPAAQKKTAEDSAAAMINTAAIRPLALEDLEASDAGVSARVLHELMVTDLRPELARIEVPTKVLYVKPQGIPLTDAQIDGFYASQYALLKGVVLVRIPDSAHVIMWDQPGRFQKEVSDFLP
jgi:pimeloyl-ACP methyl ester carboxylesterase